MSLEVPEPILDTSYSAELAQSIIHDEIQHTEGFMSLSPQQKLWFEKYAAPILVNEGFGTGRAVTRELAEDGETQEERLSREAEIFVSGAEEERNYLGRL